MSIRLTPADERLIDLYFTGGKAAIFEHFTSHREACDFLNSPVLRHYLQIDDEFDARSHRATNMRIRRELLEAISDNLKHATDRSERLTHAICLLRVCRTPIDTPITVPPEPPDTFYPSTRPSPPSTTSTIHTPTPSPSGGPARFQFNRLPPIPHTPPIPRGHRRSPSAPAEGVARLCEPGEVLGAEAKSARPASPARPTPPAWPSLAAARPIDGLPPIPGLRAHALAAPRPPEPPTGSAPRNEPESYELDAPIPIEPPAAKPGRERNEHGLPASDPSPSPAASMIARAGTTTARPRDRP